MKEYFIISGLLWFLICFIIGAFKSNQHKFSIDAVENYVNGREGFVNFFFWIFIGIFGLTFFYAMGGIFA